MTKPNLDEKRDVQFRHYRERQHPGKECPMCSDLYHGWNAGWNAAISALRDVPGEFDLKAFVDKWAVMERESLANQRYIRRGAEWQFERDKERIAALTAVCDAQVVTLVELNERVAELESALEFYAERRLYVNVGLQNDLYTDAGNRARQALKRDGGSDAQE